jgi:hypothetical protein
MPATGTLRHDRQGRGQGDEARARDARRALGAEHGHQQQQDLLPAELSSMFRPGR